MRDYKYAVTLNNKIIARSTTRSGAVNRYYELCKYLDDSTIIVKCYKGTSKDLKVINLK